MPTPRLPGLPRPSSRSPATRLTRSPSPWPTTGAQEREPPSSLPTTSPPRCLAFAVSQAHLGALWSTGELAQVGLPGRAEGRRDKGTEGSPERRGGRVDRDVPAPSPGL